MIAIMLATRFYTWPLRRVTIYFLFIFYF